MKREKTYTVYLEGVDGFIYYRIAVHKHLTRADAEWLNVLPEGKSNPFGWEATFVKPDFFRWTPRSAC